MSNARIVVGTTGGQMELSETTGVTGATGYGTIYTSVLDNKLHFVDSSGNDIKLDGAVIAEGNCNLVSTGVGGASTGSTAAVVLGCGANNGSGNYTVLIGDSALNGHNGANHVIIGKGACADANNDAACDHVIIGSGARTFCRSATGRGCNVVIGTNACTVYDGGQIAIGAYACAQSAITYLANRSGVALGLCAQATGLGSNALGALTSASAQCSLAVGLCACSTAAQAVALGGLSRATCTGSVALGYGIVTERDNTAHVNNLLALGQGVSKGHDIGSTGGTVTVDWNDSNTQKMTLSSNITSLTLSNPIQGGVYSLIVEQGGTGNTITWPSGAIKWPGGTPPTLTSGATGDTDVISLIYDPAGGTGYLGNANLAFS